MTTPSRHLLLATTVMGSLMSGAAASAQVLADDSVSSVQRENEGEQAEQGGPTAAGQIPDGDPQDERTGLLALFPNAYGSIELRHTTLRVMSKDKGFVHPTYGPILLDNKNELADSPHWELRPTIGSTFFNGALDTSFTYVFLNNVGSDELHKFDVINYTQWNVIEGKFNNDSPYSLGPSAFTDLMTGDNTGASFAYSDIGFFGEANYQLQVPTGSLSLRGYLNPSMEIYSPAQNAKNRSTLVRSNDQGADRGTSSSPLVDDPSPDTRPAVAHQMHPMYLAFYGVGATYRPNPVPALSLALGFDIIETWKPVYKEYLEEGQTETTVKLDHHQADAVSYVRFTTTYEISKKVTLVNQLRHYTAGIWQRGVSDTNPELTGQTGNVSWENRLSLVINLF